MGGFLGPGTRVPVALDYRQSNDDILDSLREIRKYAEAQQDGREFDQWSGTDEAQDMMNALYGPLQSVRRPHPVAEQGAGTLADAQLFAGGLGLGTGGMSAAAPQSSRSVVPNSGDGSSPSPSSPAPRSSPPRLLARPSEDDPMPQMQPQGQMAPMPRAQVQEAPPERRRWSAAGIKHGSKLAPYAAQVRSAQIGSQGRYDNTELKTVMDAQNKRLDASVNLVRVAGDMHNARVRARAIMANAKGQNDMLKAWGILAKAESQARSAVERFNASSSEDSEDAAKARNDLKNIQKERLILQSRLFPNGVGGQPQAQLPEMEDDVDSRIPPDLAEAIKGARNEAEANAIYERWAASQ